MWDLMVTVATLIDRYWDNYIIALHRETKVNFHRLSKLKAALGDLKHIDIIDIEAFINAKKSPASRNRYRELWNTLMVWGNNHALVTHPVPLKMEREYNQRTVRLTKDEEARLVGWMTADLKAAFYAALDTGLRKGTLTRLTPHMVEKEGTVLNVPGTIQKHKQSQRIPLTKRMQRLVWERRHRLFLFDVPRFERQWQEAKRQAGLPDLHWHDLRGEFASRLDEAGVEVSTTSRLLGHTNLQTTQRYLRSRVTRDREAIEKLGV